MGVPMWRPGLVCLYVYAMIRFLLWFLLSPPPPAHTEAALRHATIDAPARALLVISWHESRHDPQWVNYAAPDGSRKRGRISERTAEWRGPYACGSLGKYLNSWAECQWLARDLDQQYWTAAYDLGQWAEVCRKRGTPTLECAAARYAGGNQPGRWARWFGWWVSRVAGF